MTAFISQCQQRRVMMCGPRVQRPYEHPGGRSGTRNVSSRHATLNVIVRAKVAVYRSTGSTLRQRRDSIRCPVRFPIGVAQKIIDTSRGSGSSGRSLARRSRFPFDSLGFTGERARRLFVQRDDAPITFGPFNPLFVACRDIPCSNSAEFSVSP